MWSMSPHQRVSSLEASAAKSRLIRSARAAAAGAAMVVFFPPLRRPALQALGPHQPGHPLAARVGLAS
jgi:hypothetical protein